jgi:peptide/nickel transport system substrate-binding protein
VNKDVDALIDAGASTFDETRRRRIYADVQKRIFDEAPWLFMYRVTSFTAVGDKVKEIHTLQGPEFHYVFPLAR